MSCQTKSAQNPDVPVADPQQVLGYTINLIDLTRLSYASRVPKEQHVIRLFITK